MIISVSQGKMFHKETHLNSVEHRSIRQSIELTFPSRTSKSVSKHESKRMKKCITLYGDLLNGKNLKSVIFQ
jgi:hypothetical protein